MNKKQRYFRMLQINLKRSYVVFNVSAKWYRFYRVIRERLCVPRKTCGVYFKSRDN